VKPHDPRNLRPNDWLLQKNVRARRDLSRSQRSSQQEAGRRLSVSTRRLTQVLGRVTGLAGVCEVAVRYVARCVRSRFAVLAVPTFEDELTILATHGYPLDLVRMLRISSGTGVIGSVHASGTPMLVEDVATVPGMQRRPRYRTNSFIAVPICAGNDVLGVVCVTDRFDDQPFTREDLATVRAVAAPVGLALARERARRDAEGFARAAILDPVSGLFNRRYFHERLDEELDRARRHNTTVALLMIDIDNFKGINDRFGHLTGDLVIRGVGDILKRSVRKFDLCTRFGGEEFAIVMPGSGPENSVPVAERIRQRIEAFRPQESELADLRVTASIGMAVSGGASARELIAHADQALYEAKRSGKNRLVEWKPPDEDRTGNARKTR
jgi:diguanylate cyclase (GGDEF)-like protein